MTQQQLAVVTPQNFFTLAMRTASDKCGTFNVNPDYIHAAMGLADEHLELIDSVDETNACEELIDAAWFVALGLSTIPTEFVLFNIFERRPVTVPDTTTYSMALAAYTGPAKKAYAYGACKKGHPGRCYEDEFKALDTIMQVIIGVFDSIGQGRYEEFMTKVIHKLQIRYPDKFNIEDATNRDLDAERAILEG